MMSIMVHLVMRRWIERADRRRLSRKISMKTNHVAEIAEEE